MTEQWKPIKEYEGVYEVSDQGRVRSLDRLDANGRHWDGQVLRPSTSGGGYAKVQLSRDSRVAWHRVHRLVATAFLANPANRPQVNHINGDKSDNRVENLEWCSAQQNMRHARRSGIAPFRPNALNEWQVRIAKRCCGLSMTYAAVSRCFHVSAPTVRKAVRGLAAYAR